jgi:hypothetical protein
MSEGSALNVRELLRLIAEQQATLVKLQQLVVEHVLAESRPGPTPGVVVVAPAVTDAASDPMVVPPQPATLAPADQHQATSSEPEAVPSPAASTKPEKGAALPDAPAAIPPPPEESASAPPPTPSTDSPFGDAAPREDGATTPRPLSPVPTAVNARVGRYLNRPASMPAKHVTSQELYRLSRLRDVGDVGQLVLQFGEYRGATLFQVAQTDPDYLRSLAFTAQRPQVRAAAIQLVRALEASEQPAGRRRSPKSSSARRVG